MPEADITEIDLLNMVIEECTIDGKIVPKTAVATIGMLKIPAEDKLRLSFIFGYSLGCIALADEDATLLAAMGYEED